MIDAPLIVAGLVVLALVVYALTGGADFGGGVLDLLARGPRAEEQRRAIERAIAPIWEANHVWLILVVVLLFVGFPRAWAAISTALFVPLLALLLGVVLRGAAFTFRHYDAHDDATQRRWGRLFAIASLFAPIALGVCVGALAAGIELDGLVPRAGWFGWARPFPILTGLLTLALVTLLASVYLTCTALGEAVQEDFRRRALGALLFASALAVAGALLAPATLAPRLWPATIPAALAALATFASLRARAFRLARLSAAALVVTVVLGWALAQAPLLVPPALSVQDSAAPAATLRWLLGALALGAPALVAALAWLYRTFDGRRPFDALDPPA